MSTTSQAILRTLWQSLKVSIGEVQILKPDGTFAWRISAQDAAGERWTAEHSNYDDAVGELAAMLGFGD